MTTVTTSVKPPNHQKSFSQAAHTKVFILSCPIFTNAVDKEKWKAMLSNVFSVIATHWTDRSSGFGFKEVIHCMICFEEEKVKQTDQPIDRNATFTA